MDEARESRRHFLLSSTALTGAWLASNWPGIAAAEHAAHVASLDGPVRFTFFNAADAADVEAVTAQILPSGATPGRATLARRTSSIARWPRSSVNVPPLFARGSRISRARFTPHIPRAHRSRQRVHPAWPVLGQEGVEGNAHVLLVLHLSRIVGEGRREGCGIGSCGVPGPSLGDYLAGTGLRGAADAAGEC
jgi:hypothetical protein